MEITLEKVDEIIRRKKVSYRAAKEALEQNNGDVLEALASLEGKKAKANTTTFWGSVKELIHRISLIRVSFEKEDSVLLDLPLTVVLVLSFIFTPVVIGLGILFLLLGYSLRFRRGTKNLMTVPSIDLTKDDVE